MGLFSSFIDSICKKLSGSEQSRKQETGKEKVLTPIKFKWVGNHDVNCAYCFTKITVTFDDDVVLEEYEYENWTSTDLMLAGFADCPICKIKNAFLFNSEGKIKTRDMEWDQKLKIDFDKIEELREKIGELDENIHEENSCDENMSPKLEKLSKMEERLEKMEIRLDEKIEKYSERRDRRQEKFCNKH